jgi:hypothetical protein
MSQSNNWAAWINGAIQLESTNNTYDYNPGSYYLGYASLVDYFDGDVAEMLLFNRTLTLDEKITVGKYLLSKYNLSQYTINGLPPGTPTNLTATGVAPYQLNLQWTPTSTNETGFDIERKLGAGGTYQVIGNVGVTNFLDTTAFPTNQYFYKIRALNFFGTSGYSTAISPPSVSLTNWPAVILENETNKIGAQAADADGTVSSVQFIANNSLIGTATSAPYTNNWMPTMQGVYSLTALATDNQGNSQYSAPITVTVYLDANGDGIPDIWEVQNGDNPLNPWQPPPFNPNDHTAPTITLLIPTNAIIVH